jgi:hypothetical protein
MLAEPEGRGSTDAALSEEHPIASAAAAPNPHTDTGRAILIMFLSKVAMIMRRHSPNHTRDGSAHRARSKTLD